MKIRNIAQPESCSAINRATACTLLVRSFISILLFFVSCSGAVGADPEPDIPVLWEPMVTFYLSSESVKKISNLTPKDIEQSLRNKLEAQHINFNNDPPFGETLSCNAGKNEITITQSQMRLLRCAEILKTDLRKDNPFIINKYGTFPGRGNADKSGSRLTSEWIALPAIAQARMYDGLKLGGSASENDEILKKFYERAGVSFNVPGNKLSYDKKGFVIDITNTEENIRRIFQITLAIAAGADVPGLEKTRYDSLTFDNMPAGAPLVSAPFTPGALITVTGKIGSNLPFGKYLNVKPKDKEEFSKMKAQAGIVAVKNGDALLSLLQVAEKKAQASLKARAPYRKAKGKETLAQRTARMDADPEVQKTQKELKDAWSDFNAVFEANKLPGATVRSNDKGAFTITLPQNAYTCCFWLGRVDGDYQSGDSDYLPWASELCVSIENPAKTLEIRKAASLWQCPFPSL